MDKVIDIRSYFTENTPGKFQGVSVMNTAISSLLRAGVDNMDALCAMPEKDVALVRNIGAKRLELVLLLRDRYAAGE